jgi:hypothetical protein
MELVWNLTVLWIRLTQRYIVVWLRMVLVFEARLYRIQMERLRVLQGLA